MLYFPMVFMLAVFASDRAPDGRGRVLAWLVLWAGWRRMGWLAGGGAVQHHLDGDPGVGCDLTQGRWGFHDSRLRQGAGMLLEAQLAQEVPLMSGSESGCKGDGCCRRRNVPWKRVLGATCLFVLLAGLVAGGFDHVRLDDLAVPVLVGMVSGLAASWFYDELRD